MAHAFDGAWAKLERAREHIATLNEEILESLKDYQGGLEVHVDEAFPRYRFWVDPVQIDASTHTTLVAGDAVHNIRAALDYAVCEVSAAARSSEPTQRNAFPIHDEEERFERSVRDVKPAERSPLFGLDPNGHAWAIIEEAQPYKNPLGVKEDMLWRLSFLSNRDKHRALYLPLFHPYPTEPIYKVLLNGNVVIHELNRQQVPLPAEAETRILVAELLFDVFRPSPDVQVIGRLGVQPTIGTEEYDFGIGTLEGMRQRAISVIQALQKVPWK